MNLNNVFLAGALALGIGLPLAFGVFCVPCIMLAVVGKCKKRKRTQVPHVSTVTSVERNHDNETPMDVMLPSHSTFTPLKVDPPIPPPPSYDVVCGTSHSTPMQASVVKVSQNPEPTLNYVAAVPAIGTLLEQLDQTLSPHVRVWPFQSYPSR